MKLRLADALPDLSAQVAAALRDEGRTAAAEEVLHAVIDRCRYDRSVNAGYIYLVQAHPVIAGEIPAAETVAFADPHWFNVDLRSTGAVFGIELLSPPAAFRAIAKPYRSWFAKFGRPLGSWLLGLVIAIVLALALAYA